MKKAKKESPGGLAVIYCRYSSHSQKDESIEQQIDACRKLADEVGLNVVDIYPDRAISGRSDNRPQFQRMMADAALSRFKYLIVWKSDRIGRNMLEQLTNEQTLARFGVQILYCAESYDDSAAGRFAARSMMNVNQFYSESMAENIVRGMRQNAEQCLVTNGHLPFGYKRDKALHYVIDEPAAEIVREIYRRALSRESYASIARDLNERGIRTSFKGPFNKNSFFTILRNERYRGVYLYNDIRVENGIPRIIDDATWYKVQSMMDKKKVSRHAGECADYVLTGKLFCGECGARMVGVSGHGKSGATFYYYKCRKARTKECKKEAVQRDRLELTVATVIAEEILTPEMMNWIADETERYQKEKEEDPAVLNLRNRLGDVNFSIKNIMKAIESGIITDTTKDRLVQLEAEKADISEKLMISDYDKIDISRDDVLAWLESFRGGDVADPEYRQTLFDNFLTSVILYDDHGEIVFVPGTASPACFSLSEPVRLPPPSSSAGCSTISTICPPKRLQSNTYRIYGGLAFGCAFLFSKKL